MSHEVDEYYAVYDKRVRRAAKDHQCSACSATIRAGDRYIDARIIFDSTAETVKRCGRCETIHTHLVKLGDGETWPDERLECGRDYIEEWRQEPPEEIQALIFATHEEASALLASTPNYHSVPSSW